MECPFCRNESELVEVPEYNQKTWSGKFMIVYLMCNICENMIKKISKRI